MNAIDIPQSQDEDTRILVEMFTAAHHATNDWMQSHKDNDGCGYAEVTVPREYGLRFAAAGAQFTRRSDRRFGIMARCDNWQSANAQEHVARAMEASLIGNGVPALVNSWLG